MVLIVALVVDGTVPFKPIEQPLPFIFPFFSSAAIGLAVVIIVSVLI